MKAFQKFAAQAGLTLTLLAALSTQAAQAQSIVLSIDSQDEEIVIPLQTIPAEAPPIAPSTMYIGTYQGDGFKIKYGIKRTLLSPYNGVGAAKVKFDPLADGITVVNQSGEAHVYDLKVMFPIAASQQALSASAAGSVKLTTVGAGSVTCGGTGAGVFSLITDTGTAASLIPCPFAMGSSGSGTAQMPFFTSPPIAGAALTQFGMQVSANLTAGDTLLFQPGVTLSGTTICPGDQNFDFIVNSEDLASVLGYWGQLDLRADLTQDGLVDSNDLILLLGNFQQQCGLSQPPQGQIAGEDEVKADGAATPMDASEKPELQAPLGQINNIAQDNGAILAKNTRGVLKAAKRCPRKIKQALRSGTKLKRGAAKQLVRCTGGAIKRS